MSKHKEKSIERIPPFAGKIYIRNSGRGETDVLKPESQLRLARQVLERLGATFRDEDVFDEGPGLHSAFKRSNLDEFDDMLSAAIADPHCKYIVSYDSSRVFRNLEVGLATLRQIERHGIEWHTYVEGHLSLKSQADRFKTIFKLLFDEEDSRNTSRRLVDNHYAPARAAGIYFSHHAPIGLDRRGSFKKNTLHWEPNQDFVLVEKVLDLYLAGYGAPAIVAELSAYRYGKQGKPLKMRLVQNIIYRVERYKPFLAPDKYLSVLDTIDQRRRRAQNHRVTQHPALLLRGLAYCAVCDAKFTAETGRKRTNDNYFYQFYRHARDVPCAQPKHLGAVGVDDSFWTHLAFLERLTPNDKADLRRFLLQEQRIVQDPRVAERITALQNELQGLIRMSARGAISDLEFSELRAQLDAEIENWKHVSSANAVSEFRMEQEMLDRALNATIRDLREVQQADPDGFNQWLRLFVKKAYLKDARVERIEMRGKAFAAYVG